MEFQDNAQLQMLVECAPIGICIIDAKTFVAEMLNDKFLEIAGKSKASILDKWYWEAFPEVKDRYQAALENVAKTLTPYYADEVELTLNRYGRDENIFVTFVYAPVLDDNGKASKIAIWVLENTRQVNERKKVDETIELLEKERNSLNEFFMEAPAGSVSGPGLISGMKWSIQPTRRSLREETCSAGLSWRPYPNSKVPR